MVNLNKLLVESIRSVVLNESLGKAYIVKGGGSNWHTRNEDDEKDKLMNHKTFKDAHDYLSGDGFKKLKFDANSGVTHYTKGEK
jgi:hypothetical protein